MNITSFFKSRSFGKIVIGVAGLLVLLIVFGAGIAVGHRKASFSYRWGENYHRNFGGPRGGFFGPLIPGDIPNPHGAFGKILNISLPTFTVQNPDEVEKTVLVASDTIIRRFNETVSPETLVAGEYVVVLGEPNEAGQVTAKLIRIMPEQPRMPMMQPNRPTWTFNNAR